MQKEKQNLFHDKFSLLNSQEIENNVDIKWSSSSSSDYENTSCNEKFINFDRNKNRKRKRKKKVPKNISNLDVTFVDSLNNQKSNSVIDKSPILTSKHVANPVSPILMSNRLPPNKDIDKTSPILCSKSSYPKSPIIKLKCISPNLKKVRKKLSYEENDNRNKIEKKENSTTENITKQSGNVTSIYIKSETTSIDSDSSLKIKLMDKVKNFFDSHFSSDNTSQNISDTPTPTEATETSKAEEIDILTCLTQTPALTKLDHSNSESITIDKSSKKMKYKKGGLAFRLNALLKKQNAHISLWQHERFLAGNSSFVIPKEENIVFRIQSVVFTYGCYLLYAIDFDSNKYIIAINCKYAHTNIFVDTIFKLYEPYRILDFNDEYKIIINVSKYECVAMKQE